jgi:hypothetical protein
MNKRWLYLGLAGLALAVGLFLWRGLSQHECAFHGILCRSHLGGRFFANGSSDGIARLGPVVSRRIFGHQRL